MDPRSHPLPCPRAYVPTWIWNPSSHFGAYGFHVGEPYQSTLPIPFLESLGIWALFSFCNRGAWEAPYLEEHPFFSSYNEPWKSHFLPDAWGCQELIGPQEVPKDSRKEMIRALGIIP